MKVINLFGAPSSGKSTAMLGLTFKMKMAGLSVENTPEYFKEVIFEKTDPALFGGQLFVLGEQNRRLARLIKTNQFAVTDCPLPLIGYYTPESYIDGFHQFIDNLFNKYENENYFIVRHHQFENEKRIHDEKTSQQIEQDLPLFLKRMNITFTTINSGPNLVDHIFQDLLDKKIITNHKTNKLR